MDYHYFQECKSLWDIIEQHSQLVNENNPSTKYGYRYLGTENDTRKKGQINFYYYQRPKNKFLEFLKKEEKRLKEKYSLSPNTLLQLDYQIEANNYAREKIIDYIKNNWVYNEQKGLVNIIAQTRIAASYGLLQMLYSTAVLDNDYPETLSDIPEMLNDHFIGLNYCVRNLKLLFFRHNKFSLEETKCWEPKPKSKFKFGIGYESALMGMFYQWKLARKIKDSQFIKKK
ncbi:MAG: hypothetical protein JEY94_12775 [Melioribacteraceae bacterium]|nr:hypothetical protein [Melioribacteraceae bacterium]